MLIIPTTLKKPGSLGLLRQSQGSIEMLIVMGLVVVIGASVATAMFSFRLHHKTALTSLNQTQSFYATEMTGRALLFQTLGVPPTVTTARLSEIPNTDFLLPPPQLVKWAGLGFSSSTFFAFNSAWAGPRGETPNGLAAKSYPSLTAEQSNDSGGGVTASESSTNLLSNTTRAFGSGNVPDSYVRTLASGTKQFCGTQDFSNTQGSTFQTCVQFSSVGGACVENTDSTEETVIQGGGYFGPAGTTIVEKMNVSIRTNALPYPEFNLAFNGVSVPSMIFRSRSGQEDTATLTQVCNILGYRSYVSSVCRGPDGCNYRSPGNNTMLKYDTGTKQWITVPAAPQATTTFLYGITCRGKKQCYGEETAAAVDCTSPSAVVNNDVSPFFSGSAGYELWDRYKELQAANVLTTSAMPNWCLWGTSGCAIGNVWHNDDTSHLTACRMMGYSEINTRTSNSFSSPGDNGTINWIPASKRFEFWPGSRSNSYIGKLNCKGRLAQSCFDKPDWIFK